MKIVAYVLISIAVVVLATVAGFLYLGYRILGPTWVKGNDTVTAPDGYTYFLMHEHGLMQDPGEKLMRAKDIHAKRGYEELGYTCTSLSQLILVRPADIPQSVVYKLYLSPSNVLIASAHQHKVPFAYDMNTNHFYDSYGDDEVNPFLLIGADSQLYEPDVFWLIYLVVEEYHWYLNSLEYIRNDMSGGETIDYEFEPQRIKAQVFREGLTHPNAEVRKLSKWLMEIQEKGVSERTEAINELIAYLRANADSNNSETREHIMKIFEYTGWKDDNSPAAVFNN